MSAAKLRSLCELNKTAQKLFRIQPIRSSSRLVKKDDDIVTHTGQYFEKDDYRQARFALNSKWVNKNFAIDLIRDDPVVVCTKRVVSSNSGGPLGHPTVFINLDPPGVHTCGYSGRKFVLKKYYDPKTMGPSITFEKYCEEIGADPDN